jgi:hypothetical protein
LPCPTIPYAIYCVFKNSELPPPLPPSCPIILPDPYEFPPAPPPAAITDPKEDGDPLFP